MGDQRFAFRFAQAQPAHSPPLDHGPRSSGFFLFFSLNIAYLSIYVEKACKKYKLLYFYGSLFLISCHNGWILKWFL